MILLYLYSIIRVLNEETSCYASAQWLSFLLSAPFNIIPYTSKNKQLNFERVCLEKKKEKETI